jgi:biopolymer transport protein ExbD
LYATRFVSLDQLGTRLMRAFIFTAMAMCLFGILSTSLPTLQAAEPLDIVVRIKAPSSEPSGKIVAIIDAAKKAGATRVELAVNGPKEKRITATLHVDQDELHENVVKVLDALAATDVQQVTMAVLEDRIAWAKFSAADLKLLTDEKETVVVYCRADWCLTCKMLDQAVFSDPEVITAINKSRVATLRADYTKPSSEIKKYLERMKSQSVPTIVVYSSGEPVVLTEKITKQQLLKALRNIRESK